jgi:hypothetical protein
VPPSYSRYALFLADPLEPPHWSGPVALRTLGAKLLEIVGIGEDGRGALCLNDTDLLCHDHAEAELADGRRLLLFRSREQADDFTDRVAAELSRSLALMESELAEILAG